MTMILKRLISPAIEKSLFLRHLSKEPVIESKKLNSIPKTETPTNSVLLSDTCLKRLQDICEDGSFLRVTVEGGGCSGFQYKFDLDNKMNEDDISFGKDMAKVVIDAVSLEYCAGSTIDYHTELIRSGFRIVGNPKAEQGCSCGASFAIKLD